MLSVAEDEGWNMINNRRQDLKSYYHAQTAIIMVSRNQLNSLCSSLTSITQYPHETNFFLWLYKFHPLYYQTTKLIPKDLCNFCSWVLPFVQSRPLAHNHAYNNFYFILFRKSNNQISTSTEQLPSTDSFWQKTFITVISY